MKYNIVDLFDSAVLCMKQKYRYVTQTEMFEAAEMSTLGRIARLLR